MAQYQQHPAYAPLCAGGKVQAYDFPTFGEKAVGDCAPAFDFAEGGINLLFCGTIDDAFRSPRYLLETCVPLFARLPNLRLYFLGSLTSAVLTEFATQYPDHVILHPIVESDVAAKTIAQADMLLNIGNNITNMMPSKIFDYFATGKPIVNVQKIEHCPARPYFEQYPMQITLDEFARGASAHDAPEHPATAAHPPANAAHGGTGMQAPATQNPTEALAAFFAAYHGKQLPFAEVLPLYQTATPEHVAHALAHMIEELQQ